MLPEEAERCEITGKVVMPGLLERCEISGKKVLPSELERSAASGTKALKRYFVSSSVSGARILEQEAVRSMNGKYCAAQEARICLWSGAPSHPDDLRVCEITGVPIHFRYTDTIPNGHVRLESLNNLLNGVRRKADQSDTWNIIESKTSDVLGNRVKVEVAELSPDGNHLAVVFEFKDWFGLRTRHAGLLYSIKDGAIDGRIVLGKRGSQSWIFERAL